MSTGKKLPVDIHINLVPQGFSPYEDQSLLARDVLANELHCGTCDLHVHSIAYDGTDSAGDILKMAKARGLYAFSITDRDTIASTRSMMVIVEKLLKMGMPLPHFIRGLEMSARYGEFPVVLLAYFPILNEEEQMTAYLEGLRNARRERNRRMCEQLTACGLKVSLEELEAAGPYVVGRLQVAKILLAKGYVITLAEAFQSWLTYGRPGFVPYDSPQIETAIQVVRQAGGVPVLAHPGLYQWLGRGDGSLERQLAELQSMGLLGVEVVFGDMAPEEMDELASAARNLHLLGTSGSGYHGYQEPRASMYEGAMDFSRWID